MSQKRQDFSAAALVGVVLSFTVLKDDGTALDLTPYNAMTWQLALGGPGGEIVATKTLAAGIAKTDPVNGKCTVTVAPADVALSGLYFHVMNGQIGAAQPVRLFEGRGVVSGSPVAAA